MSREEALQAIKEKMDYYESDKRLRGAIETLVPELRESEDERIRKLLIWQVHRNIEDETNDLAGSVYDGIKGHDPELEESIEDWKKCLAWLEKQKEQKPADLSEMMVHKEPYLAPVPIPMVADEQKPEWSEEDEKMLEYVIGDLNDAKQLFHAKDAIDLCDKEIAWLKSLRPSWKPGEE